MLGMDRTPGTVNLNGGGDRFIPRRAGRSGPSIRAAFHGASAKADRLPANILEQDPSSWRRHNYFGVLDSTFQLQSQEVLDFSVNPERKRKRHRADTNDETFGKKTVTLWPCRPRRNPCIGSPTCVFDLPLYSECQREVPVLDLLDWSSQDYITAGLGEQLYIMKHTTCEVIKHEFKDAGLITCVKSNPDGSMISASSISGVTRIINAAKFKVLGQVKCKCSDNDQCQVTSTAWSPTGNMFATGCYEGWICTYTKDITFKSKKQVHVDAVLYMSVSPDSRYMATSGDDLVVKILKWPSLDVFMQMQYDEPATAITWHPWKSALLAVGTAYRRVDGRGRDRVAQIEVWNVPKREMLSKINPIGGRLVDSILFNDITGEMVVSICIDEYVPKSRVVVLSSFSKVVDTLHNHFGRLKTLLFNPDNTKLACASTFENLYLWNFFEDSNSTSRRRQFRSLWSVPLVLAMSEKDDR